MRLLIYTLLLQLKNNIIMKKINLILVFMVVSSIMTNVIAQVVSIIPSNTGNDRNYSEDYATMIRPGLSLIGFDNSNNDQYGLGLKQVINEAYGSNIEIKDKFIKILNIGNNSIEYNITNDDIIDNNSKILQYKAFEALTSYVLEKNGITSFISNNTYNIPIREHSVVIAEIKQFFNKNFNDNIPLVEFEDDYVHNLNSYGNIARFLDLYLAIENAYKEWNYSEWNNQYSTILPTFNEKYYAFSDYSSNLNNDLYDNNLKYEHGLLASLFGVQEDEVEPGNRPLKGYFNLGYGSLVTENNSTFFNQAISKASEPTTDNSKKYWMYQSDNGKRLWAEGPFYLHFTLPDALQFWHAARANGILGSVNDPFRNSWFLNPLSWLADLSTPDGSIPPVDDGNKSLLNMAHLYRWGDVYGDSNIGKKYNTVRNNIHDYRPNSNTSNNLYLIDIAIPKQPLNSEVNLGNLASPSEHQWLIRHTDSQNNDHYLLFNKEYGKGITRGEGHEQPDQMQILYYMNDDSYLIDPGYDSGSPELNSSWNGFLFNNVMHYSAGYLTKHYGGFVNYQNYGGLESPEVSISKARKVSEHMDVRNSLYRHISNKVRIFEGELDLDARQVTPWGELFMEGVYKRRVIFITDDNPYIIDFNRMKEQNQPTGMYQKMHYYGNSDYLINSPTIEQWSYWEIANSNPISNHSDAKNLYIASISEDNIDDDVSYGINDYFTNKEIHVQEYSNYVGDSKQPYKVERKIYAHSTSEKDFGLITFLKISDQMPAASLNKLSLGSNIHAGYYSHGGYRDIAILRNTESGTFFI